MSAGSKGGRERVTSRWAMGLGLSLCFGLWCLCSQAEVVGFEHLDTVSIECGKSAIETAHPRLIKGHPVCTYENQLCKVLSRNLLQFEAYITVDCQLKDGVDICLGISECAKSTQMSEAVADEVRRRSDPNFSGAADGAVAPDIAPRQKSGAKP